MILDKKQINFDQNLRKDTDKPEILKAASQTMPDFQKSS